MPEPKTLDPLDAALAGRPTTDVDDLSTFVDDLVATYMPADDLPRSPALTRFTEVGVVTPREEISSPGHRWGKAAAAVVGTVAGKLMLGGAVAVAAVGGLHASGAVEVPLLPEVGEDDLDGEVDHPAPDPDADAPADPRTSVNPPPSDSTGPSPSAPASTRVDGGVDGAPQAPTIGGPSESPGLTIPAPTVPPDALPDETPPILDRDVLLPGPDLPDTPI